MEGDPTARRLLQVQTLRDLQMRRLQELVRIVLHLRLGRDIQDEAQVEHARVVLHAKGDMSNVTRQNQPVSIV